MLSLRDSQGAVSKTLLRVSEWLDCPNFAVASVRRDLIVIDTDVDVQIFGSKKSAKISCEQEAMFIVETTVFRGQRSAPKLKIVMISLHDPDCEEQRG